MAHRSLILLAAAACGGSSAPPAPAAPSAPAPTAAPAEAAPRTLRFVTQTAGRPSGSAEIAIAADGTRTSRFAFNDRGRGPDVTTTLVLGAGGAPERVRSTGVNYLKAPVDEEAKLEGGELVWRSREESGRAPRGSGFFLPRNGPFDSAALLARALAAAPGKRLKVLPAGEAWIDDESTLAVELNGQPRTLRRVAIGGLGFAPQLVWLDERGEYFAEPSSWFSVIAAGAEALIPKLVAENDQWKAARAAKLAADLAARPPAAGVAITHARLFDSERRTVRADQTIVIAGDKIVAVGGPATKIPAGAQVIDAKGRMVLPGLWDMHVHLDDGDGILDLALGVTTVRDLGNDAASLSARMERFDAGTEVGPRVLRAGLIDGPGELAAPTGVLAATEAEALAAVAKFADLGYQQIKLYSSLDPALVPAIAKETHRRGMRLSGHMPHGMFAAGAVAAGYDEIQHANMLFLNFLAKPTDDLRSPARFTIVAKGAAALDLASPPVKAFLALLKRRKTVLDPTLMTFEDMMTSDPGAFDPALVAYAGRLPAGIERYARSGGLAASADERATYRASHAAMGKFVKLAWSQGIRIVAGTDATAGLTLPRELELYVAAGIPAADVLAIATIGAARVMGREKQSGSIAVGKQADLVLVDGDPTKAIGAVRNTDLVVCRGLLYDPAKLFAAVGMRPR